MTASGNTSRAILRRNLVYFLRRFIEIHSTHSNLVGDHLILLHESFQTVFPSQVFTGRHIPKHVTAYKVGTTKGFSKAFINILPTMQHEVHILHFHEKHYLALHSRSCRGLLVRKVWTTKLKPIY